MKVVDANGIEFEIESNIIDNMNEEEDDDDDA
jgi:hypothetical protein